MAHRVCPWWLGCLLASRLRRWWQDPGVIVGPFVSEAMTVLEPGPGMGFFTLETARRVGPKGRIIAVELQSQMLAGLVRRARKAGLAERIDARLTAGDHLNIEAYAGQVDFTLAFAVVHEVTQPAVFFADIAQALKPNGRLLMAEPMGHVGADEFKASLHLAQQSGLALTSQSPIRRNRTAMLVRR